ncbi:MAG: ATP-dependent helicase [Dehalococcoidia bacterium]|nr:ATP-dependent helicase [Dehalococcoidia bacterium]
MQKRGEEGKSEAVSHIYTDLAFSLDIDVRDDVERELRRRLAETPIDTRDALKPFVPEADEFQQRVIEARETTIRVVAPAGSGKTQTVINRVLSRVRDGLNPERVLILTFDNAAGIALRQKAEEQLTKLAIRRQDLKITTLNAFGYGILRKYFPREFKPVIPAFRQRRLLREVKEALREKSTDRFASLPSNVADRFYIEFFSLLKNELFDPRSPGPQRLADFILKSPQATPFFNSSMNKGLVVKVLQALIWLYMAYERTLQRERLLDFDDQKLRPFLCLTGDAQTLSALQSQFSEIIVDEFQDINRLDFEFIKALAERASLLVFGDDDQAIYGFRGCTPEFIINLDKHLKARPVASYELQVNYRCPPNVIAHADKLIRNNKQRIAKEPLPYRKEPSDIKIIATLSAGIEAKTIVSFIKQVKLANPVLNHKDFAVLYRTNAQSLPIQFEFIMNNLPYHVRDEDNILSNELLERLLGVLRVKLALLAGQAASARDSLLAVRSYFRYIGGHEADRLEQLFGNRTNFLGAISSEDFYGILPKARQSHLGTALTEMLEASSLLDTLDVLARRFNGLQGMIGSLEDVLEDKVPLGEIYELAANFSGNIRDFVKTTEGALNKARASGAGRDEDAGVRLLTYFKAKGLQWHTVVLMTCNEGIIPHRRAPLEDERRLFYVAMTRASSNLVISYVNNVCKANVQPSRFLSEAGLL